MHHRHRLRLARAAAPAWLALALAACGGNDRPDATVTAADDAATLDWRSSALVDVLANDSASRGALSLAAVDPPANGTAVIENGQLRYTPADGWFGTDSVRYTVQADAGGATAVATATFTVQARLSLRGTITDAPIANAAVTVRVGDEAIAVTADEQGRYVAEVASADPAAWVQVAGTSVDGRVRLVSLVGALSGVAARAGADSAEVDATALPALDATHWTSAEAALRARALGGTLPASAADMAASDGAVRGQDLQALAIAVNLIADGGVALPAGASDSFALLLDAAATQAFVRSQATGNADAYAAAERAVLATAPAPAGEPWAITEARVLSYSDGGNPMSSYDLAVELRPGGQAVVHAEDRRHTARWTAAGPDLAITLDVPMEQVSVMCVDDPVTGACMQHTSVYRTPGYRLRAVDGGSAVKRTVLLATPYEHVWVDGPLAGQVISASDGGTGFLATMLDLAGRAGVTADELAVGARLAGVASEPVPEGGATGVTRDDILTITGPGTGRFEIAGKVATWSLEDGWVTVRTEGLPARQYTRLERDPLTGLESWLAASVPAGAGEPVTYSAEQELLFVDSAVALTAESAARRWRSEGFVRASPGFYSLDPTYVLNPDRSASGSAIQRWQLASDGTLELVRVSGGADYLRRWIPLRRVGEHLIVLEIIDWGYIEPGMFTRRINWQLDLGPAGG